MSTNEGMGSWYDRSLDRKFSYMKEPPGSENSAIISVNVSLGSSFGSAAAAPNGLVIGGRSTPDETTGGISVGTAGSAPHCCQNNAAPRLNNEPATSHTRCFILKRIP